MKKKLTFLFFAATLLLSACGTLEISIAPTGAPIPTVTPAPTLLPPPGVTVIAIPTYTAPSPAASPAFSDVSFFRVVGVNPGCSPSAQRLFPARVRRVYASWKYANMRAGLTVRRAWYHDGKLWAEYSEPWDFAKHGASGTVSDAYIYDLDAGLEPGNYELRLYIDGQPQFTSDSNIGFVVDQTMTLEIASPNGLLTAIIAEPQKLMLREADGTQWERLRAHEISSLVWFPDSRHMLYTDTDRSQARGCTTVGIRYRTWVVDAASGDQHQIGTDDENLHHATLAPDGYTLAALTGSGWYDAGTVDLGLVFIRLDNNRQPVISLHLADFAGLPAESPSGMAYPFLQDDRSEIGAWQDGAHFRIGLNWTGTVSSSGAPGIYLFDLAAMRASRTGDLPKR